MNKNAADELKRRATRRAKLLDEIAEKQEGLKALKAEDKADGYTEKALAVVVKSIRKGIEWHADQLAFELEVDVYRRACGLTTDAAAADAQARKAIETVPGDASDDDADGVRH